MVRITNGDIVTDVPAGAYESIFAKQGYRIVDSGCADGVTKMSDEISEDDKFVADVVEKPLSQWTKEEVKRYAAIKGIDIAGTKNPTEAKHLIKAFMQEHSEA